MDRERPKLDELSSICFRCKNAMVVDMEKVERTPVQSPLGGIAIQEAHIIFFQPICTARGGKFAPPPDATIYKCTDFAEIDTPLDFKEPKTSSGQNERSLLTM